VTGSFHFQEKNPCATHVPSAIRPTFIAYTPPDVSAALSVQSVVQQPVPAVLYPVLKPAQPLVL
jgi:hypothetical protein